MKSAPLYFGNLENPATKLTRVTSQVGDKKDEAWIQELIYQHPDILEADAIPSIYQPMIPIGREVSTDSGRIDNLYVSPSGGITIVETKLWKNPEKHRTVVAQIIDYAKDLATWDYDEFVTAVRQSARARKEAKVELEEKIQPALNQLDIPTHSFQEKLAKSLTEGNFLLLIVSDQLSPNITFLTDAIQSAPGLSFTIRLMELQLYQISQSQEFPLMIVPEIVGKTVEKVRSIVTIKYNAEAEKPSVDVEAVEETEAKITDSEKLSLEELKVALPADLLGPYSSQFSLWEANGGMWDATKDTIKWVCHIQGRERRFLVFYKDGINFLSKGNYKRRFLNDFPLEYYNEYTATLEDFPVLIEMIRVKDTTSKIRYDELSADGFETIVQATIQLLHRTLQHNKGTS